MVRAMIVDDEPASAVIIRYLIESGNLPIEIVGEATDGRKALETIRELSPDLIFVDIQMPVMNGFELMEAAPDYNYIIVTAYESFEYAQRALRMGAKDILLKPVEYDALCNAVSRAIHWKFTQNELANDILEYIRKNYHQDIELNELAKLYYTTPSHIARTFKKYVGTSVIDYLHGVRIEEAQRLLETSSLDIKEIAEKCGYNSLNNFYKHFSLITGDTPAVFKKKNAR